MKEVRLPQGERGKRGWKEEKRKVRVEVDALNKGRSDDQRDQSAELRSCKVERRGAGDDVEVREKATVKSRCL